VEQGGVPLLLVVEQAGPADPPPAGSGGGEGPLPDDVQLELGQRPEDLENVGREQLLQIH
jgi:hypothetical protein